jgi:hypothetical protein
VVVAARGTGGRVLALDVAGGAVVAAVLGGATDGVVVLGGSDGSAQAVTPAPSERANAVAKAVRTRAGRRPGAIAPVDVGGTARHRCGHGVSVARQGPSAAAAIAVEGLVATMRDGGATLRSDGGAVAR